MAEVQIQMPDDKKSKNKKSNGCKKLFKKDKAPSVPLSKILDFAADYRPLMAFGSICKSNSRSKHANMQY